MVYEQAAHCLRQWRLAIPCQRALKPGGGNNIPDCGLARGVDLVLPLPVGVRLTRGGIANLHLSDAAESIQVGHRDGRGATRGGSLKREVKMSPHKVSAVAAGRNGYRRVKRDARSRGRNDGQSLLRSMGPEGPKPIVNCNNRWRSARGCGCWSAHPNRNVARRRR